MKKSLVSLVTLVSLVGLVSLTSCKKEESLGNGTQFRATMEGCTAQDGKTALDISGTALNWVSGDQIAVYGTSGCGIYRATLQTPATSTDFDNVSGETGDGPFRAFYPTTLTTDGVNVTLPATQTYVEGSINEFPMYAESSNNELAFKNLCGVLKLHLTKANTSISSIEVVANSEVNGTFSVSLNGGIPELTYVSGGTNSVVLNCTTAQDISEGVDFYITLPATFDSVKSITLTADNDFVCTKKVKNTSQINISRSQYTLVTLGENDLEFRAIGSKGGLFTINADGDQVWFSQGNLQYQASTNTWRFALNQYDYVGNDNENISATYSGWIDLFGWGTGSNPTLSSTYYAYYGTFTDWGSNTISNGGNTANSGWRTLSQVEWNYLLYTRANASSKMGGGSVNGVHGEIVLPDSWTLPAGLTFTAGQNGWQNSYTLAQWALMEAAGAVFLPTAGYRYGTSVYDVGNTGIYWPSTPWDEFFAYHLDISSYGLGIDVTNAYHSFGFAVRPVRDNN
ncbi:MAG: hypothetical protein IJK84_05005 [Bacteroidales bacterium]|nr:hypothetical protein [Bacteroidales bacterium]